MLSMITLLLISTQATLLSPSGFLIAACIFDTGEFITELLEGYKTVLFFSAQTAGLCHMRKCTQHSCLLLCKVHKKQCRNAIIPRQQTTYLMAPSVISAMLR